MARKLRPSGDEFRNKVYAFIDRYWRNNYCSPSVREISDGVEANSTSHVSKSLLQLHELDLLFMHSGTSRSYIPIWVVEIIKGDEKCLKIKS